VWVWIVWENKMLLSFTGLGWVFLVLTVEINECVCRLRNSTNILLGLCFCRGMEFRDIECSTPPITSDLFPVEVLRFFTTVSEFLVIAQIDFLTQLFHC
jgi:hypothetical protein